MADRVRGEHPSDPAEGSRDVGEHAEEKVEQRRDDRGVDGPDRARDDDRT
ncbi:hypothetical protein SAMN05421810_110108 [Amycolatopsis arida]|uniref:Uncharacterized protein n=1 Tax=Amycolatopsis arida TaxID=587909 RepID=A0A1I5ZSS6_9PSEU|nr:hypothetical protein [Amycolatopsis arida]TDX89342.1 hypothetical protein CLV69_110109 [Amycolatopsis arida]SFQ59470.1 hypothetical protein SAMN05421810_110108 [Amycolatopsis arida]